MRFLVYIVGYLLFFAPYLSAQQQTVLKCGTLIDTEAATLRSKQLIVIDDQRITAIRAGDQYIGEARVVDLSEYTCLPGLIDMHVHLTNGDLTKMYVEKFTLGVPDLAFMAARNAQITLMAGFTTVRNLGDRGEITAALRKAIDKGLVIGPRIFTAGKSPVSYTHLTLPTKSTV